MQIYHWIMISSYGCKLWMWAWSSFSVEQEGNIIPMAMTRTFAGYLSAPLQLQYPLWELTLFHIFREVSLLIDSATASLDTENDKRQLVQQPHIYYETIFSNSPDHVSWSDYASGEMWTLTVLKISSFLL